MACVPNPADAFTIRRDVRNYSRFAAAGRLAERVEEGQVIESIVWAIAVSLLGFFVLVGFLMWNKYYKCRHSFSRLQTVRMWDGGKNPYGAKHTFLCTKCGKIKTHVVRAD